jgi:hypothetical protein
MSWEDQGRQYHQWFGHGTAPKGDEPSEAGSDPMFDADNVEARIDAIARSALAHMPRKDWHRGSVSFDRQRLERLRTAMTAWIGARSLTDAAFEEHFVNPLTSSIAIGKLRAAAEGARTATTHEELGKASAELAGAMQVIGLDKWPSFLQGAAERADAYSPTQGRILLAQATTPNTATDASPGGNPAPGHYVADNPRQWINQPSVGTGECVALVQRATGAPQTGEWQPGVPVQGNTGIRPGSAIGTFDDNGHYDGHAAIYLWQDEHGIHVVDQWNRRDPHDRHIIGRQPPHERTIPFNDRDHTRINRGESYYVIE